jgi:hypothetical protein
MYRAQLRRPWHAAVLAVGVALTAVLSAAPAAAEAPSGLGHPARAAVEVVPLSADLTITRTTVGADGELRVERETSRLYRDSLGRTRTEDGSSVTINDPTTQTTVRLDPEARTFRRMTPDRSTLEPSAPRGTIARHQRLASPPRLLGEAVVGGVLAEGREYTVTVPAREGLPARVHEVTTWLSADLQLAVQTRVVAESGEVYEQTYTDIRAGSEPAAALFQVPAGYQQADPTAAGPTQATCPISYPDPVVITSFGSFLGAGFVTAFTDANAGCLFVADAAVFELPLDGFPTTALLQTVDEWFVFDTGLPVPFLPYTAFGDIGFAAASTGDATVVDSLVILQIF